MTFGETIKTIMTFSGIKSNQLAAAIGYDTSYVSRWLSGEKLPTYRKENALFQKIADFVVSVCDESELRNIAVALNIQSLPQSREETAGVIRNTLEENYFRQKNFEKSKKQSLQDTADSLVVTDTAFEKFYSLIEECIYAALNNNEIGVVEIMTTELINYSPRTERDMINVLMEFADKDHPISVRHIVDIDQIMNNVNECCRGLIHLLKGCEGLNYDVYISDDSEMTKTQMTVLKGIACLRRISDAFVPHPFFLLSRDSWLVSNSVLTFQEATRNGSPAIERVSDLHIKNHRHLIDYMMYAEFENIMNIMHPLYMEQEFFVASYNKYRNNGESWEHSFELRMSQAQKKKTVLFKTAFLDYLYHGKIVFQGEIQYFDRKDRIKHLRQVVKALKEYPDFDVMILEDNNPLLCYNEVESSVYFSERNAHATCYKIKQESYIINDVNIVNAFRQFLNALFELPDTYCIKGEKAVELIENAISWLETE